MKRYASLLATPLIVAFNKIFIIGFYSNETVFTALIVSVVVFSIGIMIIPFLIAFGNRHKENDKSLIESFNKYNYYTLGLYVILFVILPILSHNLVSELKETSQKKVNEQTAIISQSSVCLRDTEVPKEFILKSSKSPEGYENILVSEGLGMNASHENMTFEPYLTAWLGHFSNITFFNSILDN